MLSNSTEIIALIDDPRRRIETLEKENTEFRQDKAELRKWLEKYSQETFNFLVFDGVDADNNHHRAVM